MHTIRNLSKFFLLMVADAILFSAGSASVVEKPRQGEDILLDTNHRNMAKLETNSFGFPLFLESFERDVWWSSAWYNSACFSRKCIKRY
jgi:hypothetical protein